MFFGEAGIFFFWRQELANFCERDSGSENTRIKKLIVGNQARNVAGIRESGDLLATLSFSSEKGFFFGFDGMRLHEEIFPCQLKFIFPKTEKDES